jgi:ribosomal protein L31E
MKKTIEQIDASIKRWQTRLKRAVTMIDKLQKQRMRVDKAALKKSLTAKIVDESVPASTLVKAVKAVVNPPEVTVQSNAAPDDLGIPSFLRRNPDPVADQIKAEQAETKKLKAKGRIEKMKAKKRGDLKKMPLSGKAALDLINNG